MNVRGFVDDDDERPRRPTDLHLGAAESGDQEAGDYGGVKSASGRNTAGDREGYGERKRDDTDNDTGGRVRRELLPIVGFKGGDELGDEHGRLRIADCASTSDIAEHVAAPSAVGRSYLTQRVVQSAIRNRSATSSPHPLLPCCPAPRLRRVPAAPPTQRPALRRHT